ncbi:MAG: hypothetical protein R3E10_15625 [Gemmatimonadota bacterium]
MKILDTALETLGQHGYRVSVDSQGDRPLLLFENRSVFGFVASYETPAELLSDWGHTQESFLNRYSRALQLHPTKAWNAYGVFLAALPGDVFASHRFGAIEEDFNATRKIARAGTASAVEVRRALAPLLTISDADVLAKLDIEHRLASHLPDSLRLALLKAQPANRIADLIEGAT